MRFYAFLLLLITCSVFAAEVDYQLPFCAKVLNKSVPELIKKVDWEVTVKNGRIDCVTDRYAIEVDFANKWKECISQGRWYGLQTGKISGCALIVGPNDSRYLAYIEDYLHGHDMYMKIWTIAK